MSNGSGNIPKDLSLSAITSNHIHTHNLPNFNQNNSDIAHEIYELQDVSLQISDEMLDVTHDLTHIHNEFIDVKFTQSFPWFCKSNFTYQEIQPSKWNIADISDSSNQLFIRVVELTDTFTGMFLLLPRSIITGETRSVSMYSKSSEACVYINSKPDDSIRLTSFDFEWIPNPTISQPDIFVGHSMLLSKPKKMNNYLFGSARSNIPEINNTINTINNINNNHCVVFPESGPIYIKQIYLDNNNGNTNIVFVFQKFQSSQQFTLPGFALYGVH
jgi:hypothetical protein